MKTTKQQLENSIKNALSLLDEDIFTSLCDGGQNAILNMAKLVDYDVSDFVPEKEYYAEISSEPFSIKSDEDIKNFTAKLIVFNKAGNKIHEEPIDHHHFYKV